LRGNADLVITDIEMPRMNGAELMNLLRTEYPELKILCISSHADLLSTNYHSFLAKPFTAPALRAMAKKVMSVSDIAPMSEVR
jgi:YesN/AraC family two-component response regulator